MIEFAVFTAFLLAFLLIGNMASARRSLSNEEYLLGSRSFGPLISGFSAGASGNSGFMMIGAVGMGYSMGVSALWMHLCFYVSIYVFWRWFAEPIYDRAVAADALTVPGLIRSMENRKECRGIGASQVAALLILVCVGAFASAQILAAAKAVSPFYEGVSRPLAIVLSAVFITFYCLRGGYRASVWTDVLQGFIMLLVTIGGFISLLWKVGGVRSAYFKLFAIDPSLVSPFGSFDSAGEFVLHIVGFSLFGFALSFGQPTVLVRLLSLESGGASIQVAKWVYLLFLSTSMFCMIGFGIVVRAVLPGLADPEIAFPEFVASLQSPLVTGVVIAGIYSAIASSADSQILACSSALANDISPAIGKKLSLRFGVKYQQAATLLAIVAFTIIALAMPVATSTLMMFSVAVLSSGVGVAIFIVSTREAVDGRAVSVAMLLGAGMSVAWKVSGSGSWLNEVVPGIVVGLVSYYLLERLSKVAQLD